MFRIESWRPPNALKRVVFLQRDTQKVPAGELNSPFLATSGRDGCGCRRASLYPFRRDSGEIFHVSKRHFPCIREDEACTGAHMSDAANDENKGRYTTGDMARACKTTVRTVRFYEEAGVLCPQTRSEGGHRVFDDGDLQKLQLVMDLREAGLSLNDIRGLFALKEKSTDAEEATRAMSELLGTQIDEMQRKITTLRRLREELATMVAVIQDCGRCDSGGEFPKSCSNCDVMSREDLPRAVRLLWR